MNDVIVELIVLFISFTVSFIMKDIVIAKYEDWRWGGWKLLVYQNGKELLNWNVPAGTNKQLHLDPFNGSLHLRRAATHCGLRYTKDTDYSVNVKKKVHLVNID